MAYGRVKTEMHGDTSRWGHRDDVKRAADKHRRHADRLASGSYRLSNKAAPKTIANPLTSPSASASGTAVRTQLPARSQTSMGIKS